MQSSLEANKKTVQEFYDIVCNKKDFKSASKYIGSRYVQHNPTVADGPEGLPAFVDVLKSAYQGSKVEIKRIFADGDYVIIHVHGTCPNKPDLAIMDIFKLENGKIVEHWDVIQPIPETSANPNGMF